MTDYYREHGVEVLAGERVAVGRGRRAVLTTGSADACSWRRRRRWARDRAERGARGGRRARRSRTASWSTTTVASATHRTSSPPATSPASPRQRSAGACASSTRTTAPRWAVRPGARMAGARSRTGTRRSSTPTCSTRLRGRRRRWTRGCETVADWNEPYRAGVVYYLEGDRVRGRAAVERVGPGRRRAGADRRGRTVPRGRPARPDHGLTVRRQDAGIETERRRYFCL